MKEISQVDMVISHINEYGSITPLEAMREYGIMRLAARINDLKSAGFDINSKCVFRRNRYGEKVRVKQYFI